MSYCHFEFLYFVISASSIEWWTCPEGHFQGNFLPHLVWVTMTPCFVRIFVFNDAQGIQGASLHSEERVKIGILGKCVYKWDSFPKLNPDIFPAYFTLLSHYIFKLPSCSPPPSSATPAFVIIFKQILKCEKSIYLETSVGGSEEIWRNHPKVLIWTLDLGLCLDFSEHWYLFRHSWVWSWTWLLSCF